MRVRIIVDSTADLTEEIRQRLQVVPLTVHFGDEEYVDGVTITHRAFYQKLVESHGLPSTSQATPASFEICFQKVAEVGESAVVLTLSGKLSGTYQSAVIAAQGYENIYVVDSGSVTIGTGILAERALQLVDAGMDAKAVAQALEQEKQEVCLVAMVDTLEYLKRGGRISKTVAFAGELLNIKPILAVQGGEIRIQGKARGTKQGNMLLMQQIEKMGGVDRDRPMLMGFTGVSDALLQQFHDSTWQQWAPEGTARRQAAVGSVIGTHAGPGAIAVAFFRKGSGPQT